MTTISSENILLLGSLFLIAGVLIGKTSYRTGLPLLLVFLLVGMGFGTDGLGIHFNNMHDAQFIGMIALCVIIFSGGMSTKLSAIRPVAVPGLALSTVGVLLTALITGLFIFWLSRINLAVNYPVYMQEQFINTQWQSCFFAKPVHMYLFN